MQVPRPPPTPTLGATPVSPAPRPGEGPREMRGARGVLGARVAQPSCSSLLRAAGDPGGLPRAGRVLGCRGRQRPGPRGDDTRGAAVTETKVRGGGPETRGMTCGLRVRADPKSARTETVSVPSSASHVCSHKETEAKPVGGPHTVGEGGPRGGAPAETRHPPRGLGSFLGPRVPPTPVPTQRFLGKPQGRPGRVVWQAAPGKGHPIWIWEQELTWAWGEALRLRASRQLV